MLHRKAGFSLAEVLAALVIGAMILVAVLGVYNRVETGAAAVTRKLYYSQLPRELLQRIAEDVDTIITASADTKLTIENKSQNGFSTARLTILKAIYDRQNKKKTFESTIWQGNYDSDANSIVLYRSHKGLVLEDKLLDEQKEGWERELFVPICTGLTFFKIQALRGENLQDNWNSDGLPNAIVVTVSFEKPLKTLAGTWDVPDEQKITRTIAIDRTRKISFIFVKKQFEQDLGVEDSNQVDSGGDSATEDSNEVDNEQEDNK